MTCVSIGIHFYKIGFNLKFLYNKMIRLPLILISGIGLATWAVMMGLCKVLHVAFTFLAVGIVFMFMIWRKN